MAITIDIDTNEPIDQAELLEFEWRLTIAMRIGCECAPYFIKRKDALFPAILAKAEKEGRDSDQIFAEFARGVHQRHKDLFLAQLAAAHTGGCPCDALDYYMGQCPIHDTKTYQL